MLICTATFFTYAQDYYLATVPCLKKQPVIDGTPNSSEWAHSARMFPFIDSGKGEAVSHDTVFRLGLAKGKLFGMLYVNSPERSSEKFELTLDNKTVLTISRKGRYSAKTGGKKIPAQCRVISGNSSWECEFAIPLAEAKIAPAPGKTCKFTAALLFGRDKNLRIASLPWYGSWPVKNPSGILRFGKPGEPDIQVNTIGKFNGSEAGAGLSVSNGGAEAEIILKKFDNRDFTGMVTEYAGQENQEIFLPVEVKLGYFAAVKKYGVEKVNAACKKIAAKKIKTVAPAGRLSTDVFATALNPGSYVVSCVVRHGAAGVEYIAGTVPFKIVPPVSFEAEAATLFKPAINVKAECRGVRLRGKNTLNAKVVDIKSGETLGKATSLVNNKTGCASVKIPCKTLSGKNVKVFVNIKAGRKTIAEDKIPLLLPEKPEWFGHNLGKGDGPLPGWGPVKAEGNKVNVDMREIILSDSGLPEKITSRGKELLAAPVTLTIDGKNLNWSKPEKISLTGEKLVRGSRASNGKITLALRTQIEFDGMIRYDLKITPVSGPPTLKDLTLRVPEKSKYVDAKCIRKYKTFEPQILMRDSDTGISFFAENWKNWRIGKLPPEEVTRKGKITEMTVRFINAKGVKVDKPFIITWGLQPLPVRKMEKTGVNLARRIYGYGPGHESFSDPNTLRYQASGNFPEQKGHLHMEFSLADLRGNLLRITSAGETLGLRLEARKKDNLPPLAQLYFKDKNGKEKVLAELNPEFAKHPMRDLAAVQKEKPLPPRSGPAEFIKISELSPEAGSICVIADHALANSNIIQTGKGKDAVATGFELSNRTIYKRVYYLTANAKNPLSNIITKITGVNQDGAWLPLAVTWKQTGQNVKVSLYSLDPRGVLAQSHGTISYERWKKAFAGKVIGIGSAVDIAYDFIIAANECWNHVRVKQILSNPHSAPANIIYCNSFGKGEAESRFGRAHLIKATPEQTVSKALRNYRFREWYDVNMDWRKLKNKIEVKVELGGKKAKAEIPESLWIRLIKNGKLVIGGDVPVAVASVTVKSDGKLYLSDQMDKLRFSRGLKLTCPEKISGGKGGIAGGRYLGCYVKQIDANGKKAIVLPSGLRRSHVENSASMGAKFIRAYHEGFRHMQGFYGRFNVKSPVLREMVKRNLKDTGTYYMAYGPMAVNAKWDKEITPYIGELAELRNGKIKNCYNATVYCLNSPVADYMLKQLKEGIEYYNLRGLHMDNTVNCRFKCCNPLHGCGWKDRDGKLQGSYPIFGARKAFKRMIRLFHENGKGPVMLSLHAGARRFTAVGGLANMHQGGEGKLYMSGGIAKINGMKDVSDDYQWVYGVPVEILTKGARNPYGPNFSYMTVLLNGGTVRTMQNMLNPDLWWINPETYNTRKKSRVKLEIKPGSVYDPYYAKFNVPLVACPMALWWMLQDDFDTKSAKFVNYREISGYLKLSPARVDAALYFHHGENALIIVSNFNDKDALVKVSLDWSKLGLSPDKIQAFDALTDQDYVLKNETINVLVKAREYRIIRIEKK